ncbi:WD repeat protein-like protein [Coleophoma cylindrospora]|uniref:WD repeat protein-like protein n=1 Tax=Coleophoma cylindrospora TaxID=1849047 RepID=A0A3D8S845_9HELO|nr:WD repeat protein-like protein [Coleophoma cylindrospora]
MTSTPSNPKTFSANSGLGLRLTPSNSPYARTPPPRSPNRSRLYDSSLSLKRIIGATVSSPTAFDTAVSSHLFAYCAGAAAVVVAIDQTDFATSSHVQRFFRARPTAVPSSPPNPASLAPSTPSGFASDGKRAITSSREATISYSPNNAHTSFDWGDSSTPKTWTSRERIKAATCLSISHDGRLLAVGETGYTPRVLIFSLQDGSSDIPLAILNEHTYGVRAVAFSSFDSELHQLYLASLGSPNDGFLNVWSIKGHLTRLHSSNKCTSFVKDMIWVGSSIVTVGTRHIKVWRFDQALQPGTSLPTLKTLMGRNCLLGPLSESTFSCIAAISETEALVCTEKGDLCLLVVDSPQLTKLMNTGFSITCLAIDLEKRVVRIGGRNGINRMLKLDFLLNMSLPPELPITRVEREGSHLCAMGFTGQNLVTIDSKHLIEITTTAREQESTAVENKIPAPGDAVIGVTLLSPENATGAVFLTWTSDGTLRFWDLEGNCRLTISAELEQVAIGAEDFPNRCQIVRASRNTQFLAIGDKLGVVKVMKLNLNLEPAQGVCIFETKAHVSEVTDLAISEHKGVSLLASAGRDRCVQLFRLIGETWTLLQTMEDHSASVGSLRFAENGEVLISASSDRNICLRRIIKRDANDGQEMMAAVTFKMIALKASPVSIVVCHEAPASILVSLLDRTVATYDIASGRLLASFRATDVEASEAVVLDALVLGTPGPLPGRPTILAGISSTDKSVRIYDASSGAFLDREFGHTSAVTDVALLELPDSEQKVLISTGLDGTVMLWNISPKVPGLQEALELAGQEDTPSKEPISARPPLRRVMSKADLAEFQRGSPVSIPSSKPGSPPRVIRRKASRYGLQAQSPSLAPSVPSPPVSASQHHASLSEGSKYRASQRARSRSPPASPKGKNMRRPSLASLDVRGRTKSTENLRELGSLNKATEQACRTLRAYRKKLLTSESVKESVLRELDHELRLTAMALGEKSLKSKAISEVVLTELLDRIGSMFDEKLRLTKLGSEPDQPSYESSPRTVEGPGLSKE